MCLEDLRVSMVGKTLQNTVHPLMEAKLPVCIASLTGNKIGWMNSNSASMIYKVMQFNLYEKSLPS